MILRKVFEKKLSSLGDSTISSYAKSFAKSEYKACGKDLDKLQTDYMFKTWGKDDFNDFAYGNRGNSCWFLCIKNSSRSW